MADYITAEEVLCQVRKMPIQERARLKDILYSDNEGKHEIKEGLTQKRFAEGRVCPHCGGRHVRKNGHQPDGTQKYICVDCNKSFSITTKSIFFGTRKGKDVWRKFMKCMADGKSLDYCAHECGMTHATAFAWRHKILDALSHAGNDTELSGIVEADELFFPVSYKGNSQHFEDCQERRPRRRGGEVHTKGLSDELVCVPCAVDDKGNAASLVAKLGKCSKKALEKVLKERIVPGSTVCSDGEGSYTGFAKENDLKLVKIKGGRKSIGQFNIQRINNYHTQLRNFLVPFHGVSTKYLNNYLIWNNAVEYCKKYLENKLTLMLDAISAAMINIRSNDIGCRPELPIIA